MREKGWRMKGRMCGIDFIPYMSLSSLYECVCVCDCGRECVRACARGLSPPAAVPLKKILP